MKVEQIIENSNTKTSKQKPKIRNLVAKQHQKFSSGSGFHKDKKDQQRNRQQQKQQWKKEERL